MGVALGAQRCAGREAAGVGSIATLTPALSRPGGRGSRSLRRTRFFIGGTLFGDQLAGGFVHLRVDDEADVLHVLLDHRTDLGDDAGHVDAAGLEVAAARIEHGLHFFGQEGDVAALAEHGGDDAGERHDPLEVVHVLGVDEHLERAALLVRGALVEHDVVDGDVERVLEQRRLDLEGGADEGLGALHAFVHLDDFRLGRLFGLGRSGGRRGLVFGLDDVVALDFLIDLERHDVSLCMRWRPREGRRVTRDLRMRESTRGARGKWISAFAGRTAGCVVEWLRLIRPFGGKTLDDRQLPW